MSRMSRHDGDPIRVGLVGVNTYHAEVYARLLTEGQGNPQLAGARIEAIWGEPSERRSDLARTFRIRECVREPADMIDGIDLALVVDDTGGGAAHRELAAPFLAAGIATFIDKPMTTTLVDAIDLFDLAERSGAPILSCSALRFAREITDAQSDIRRLGQLSSIVGVGVNDWFYYGIHVLEAVSAIAGRGIQSIERRQTGAKDTALLTYHDGRTAIVHILRDAAAGFTISVYGQRGMLFRQISDADAYYHGQLATAIGMSASRITPVDRWDTLEILATLHAGDQSVEQGRPVHLAEVLEIPKREGSDQHANAIA